MAGVSVSEPEISESGGSDSADAYRPHLDGLRAVAVYLVVLFHAGVVRFSGGYIGVDVFFVLSGYLVTQLLLRDIARGGSIRFGRFYSRRFRRLLPAAFVALIVTAAVYTAIASSAEVSNAVGSFKAAFLYSTNWYFIHQSTGYFGADISANPVLHFWSLAVEEQFYLVWPLVLGGVFALTRRMGSVRQMRAIRIVVALGALASVIWALSLRTSDPNRAYYGTDTRAYELLAGGLISLTPGLAEIAKWFRRALWAVTVLSVLGLLVVATSWVSYNAIVRGALVTVATCVLITALEAADGGLVKRALSTRSMVYLGKVSYGTYLWHWLVILVVVRVFAPSDLAAAGIACLVATALASLSFEMLERPIRVSQLLDRHRRAVIASGLAISVASALVLIPEIVNPASASTSAAHSEASPLLTPIPKNLDTADAIERTPFPTCLGKPVSACTVVKGTGENVLLIGDSHAWMLMPTFIRIARVEHWHLSVSAHGGCPWQRELYTPFKFDACKSQKEDLYQRVIPTLKPDLVIAVNLGYGTPGPYPTPLLDAHKRRAYTATLTRTTLASVAALRADGADVLLVEQIPLPRLPATTFDPLACLERSKVLEQCRYESFLGSSPAELLYRRIAGQDPRVKTLDLDRWICPLLPVCDPVVNGQIVKWDPSHLTAQFALTLAPEVDDHLRVIGFIVPGPAEPASGAPGNP